MASRAKDRRGGKRGAAQGSRPSPSAAPHAAIEPTGRGRRRWPLVAACAALAVGGIAGALVLRGPGGPPAAPPIAVAPAAAPPALVVRKEPPRAAPTNAYVGSARCGECHDKELAAWQKSWHARALSPGDPTHVVGNFGNAHFTGSSSEASMRRAGDTSIMRANGPDGAPADFRVDWVIGAKRMQDAVTVFPDGRWQVLPVYFHVTDHAWVDYTETKQGPLTPSHPFYWTNWRRMANHECLECHATNLQVSFDATTLRWTTTFTDATVACEDCHGPGGHHSETQEAAEIVQPANAGAIGVSACARCHGPHNPLWPSLDADHAFRLGDAYDEYYDPIVVTLEGSTSGDFFADGRPRTSSFEYQGMLQSACFRKGGATCLTCHTAPHAPHEHAELRKDPDELCRRCHGAISAAAAAHSHHRDARAQRCVACHMPPVVSGVLDHFADHALDVPAPQVSEHHDVPNACGVCHPAKPAAELSRAMTRWWPDVTRRTARRVRLADAFDEATARVSARPLVAVLADRDEAPSLRGAAAILLARRFGPPTQPTLIPLLDDPDLVIRAKACEALGGSHALGPGVGDALARRLDDRILRVRLAAALALLDLHDPRGEQALHLLADDPGSSHLVLPHSALGTP